jgi:hypothetical protein
MTRTLKWLSLGLLVGGCYGSTQLDATMDDPPVYPDLTDLPPDEGGPNIVPADTRLEGAGGRDITEFWNLLDPPFSFNTRMLAFDMMKSEVKRATALSWNISGVDQWELNRAPLGGADYVTGFTEDTTPSQQKLVLWRKMAYQVCEDAVVRDAGKTTRVLFADVDPAVAISASSPAVAAQVQSLYTRFFFDPAPASEVTRATTLLTAAYADASDAKQAWRALCVGYLGSMKFLTY